MNKSLPPYLLFLMAAGTISGTLLALQSYYWGAFFSFLFLSMLSLRKSTFYVWLASFLVCLSALFMSDFHESNQHSKLSSKTFTPILAIDFIPEIDGSSLRGFGKLEGERVIFRYRIPSEDLVEQSKALKPGHICRVKGELIEPPPNSNPNMFNYKRYLYERDTHWILELDAIEGCSESRDEWKYTLIRWRAAGLNYIEARFPPETVGMTQALVFGETGRISEEMMNAYRSLGIVHLLAISGLHVGLISGMFYFILLRAGVTRELSLWMLIVFLIFYMVMTGGAPPVVRASAMLIILILFRKSPFTITTLDSLSIVFISLLFWNPYSIFDIGFQLSFTVSYCLVLSSSAILSHASSNLIQLFKVTAVAQLSSLPIMVFHFYEFSVIGFVTNLLFVPLFSLIVLPMALITFLKELIFPSGMESMNGVYGFVISGIEALSSLLAAFPFTTLVLGKPHDSIIICYIFLVLSVFKGMEKGAWRLRSFILCGFVLLHAAWVQFNPFGEVIFIDVGQGDSTLIDLPYNLGTYLIDTGGAVQFPKEEWERKAKPFSIDEDVILPFLKSKGITTIDKLLLTHGDLDHVGGAAGLMDKIKIKEILITPGSGDKNEMKEILSLAEKKGVPVKQVRAPYTWKSKDYIFHILMPMDDIYEGNNDSLVVYSEMGGLKWLFTGDLEEEGEKELVDTYEVRADVLKIGHHGSGTSSSGIFLEELKPRIGVISAGRDNRFGHPHPEVVKRLKEKGIMIHTTADQGALTYRFLGKRGTFSAQHP
jgi:competence protein ComEC